MRVVLAEVSSHRGDLSANLRALDRIVRRVRRADLLVLPELFLSGYRVGERLHRLAVTPSHPTRTRLGGLAKRLGGWVVVGAPYASPDRPGEIFNAALWCGPKGEFLPRCKRFRPNFGPFEEGLHFSAGPAEVPPVAVGEVPAGSLICYEVFFPEVARRRALAGAELLVVLSASPVTSRGLFEKLLPARAIENGVPVAYVNRVGVEDGLVFAGGSGLWDPRGERLEGSATPYEEGRLLEYELSPDLAGAWRPFRPVLRDLRDLGEVPFPDRPDAPVPL